ncbi:reticulon-4b isoform X1 [Xyrauchen texanus]|uniref:reticulon-4b isoform X1 n=1 Tax=Xyrauchen texanus TaxID=154827 RepID=UPI002241D968|nr:reticulon-4b isoform X1 [Xyrauchen texanus]
MEEADKVSSTSAGESPVEQLATVHQTQSEDARENMPHAEDLHQMIKEDNTNTASQMSEENITSSPATEEPINTTEIIEVSISPEETCQRSEETISPQSAGEMFTPERAEVTSSTEGTEATSSVQIHEESILTPQGSKVTSTEIPEKSSAADISDVNNIKPHAAEVCVAPPAAAEVCVAPPAAAEVCVAPPAAAEVCVAPPAAAEVCVAPPAAAEVCVAPPAAAEVCVAPPAAAEVCVTPPAAAEVCVAPPAAAEVCVTPPAAAEVCVAPPAAAEVCVAPPAAAAEVCVAPPAAAAEVCVAPPAAAEVCVAPPAAAEVCVTPPAAAAEVCVTPPAAAEVCVAPPAAAAEVCVTPPAAAAEVCVAPPAAAAEVCVTPPAAAAEVCVTPPAAAAEVCVAPPAAAAEVCVAPPAAAEVCVTPPAAAEVCVAPPAAAAEVCVAPPAAAAEVCVAPPAAAAEVCVAPPAAAVVCVAAVQMSSSTKIQTLHTDTEKSSDLSSEDIQKHSHTLHPSSYEPTPAAPALFQSPLSSDLKHSPPVSSQTSACPTMDSFSKDAAGFDRNVLNQSDDDLIFEIKKSPFQAFSPVNDASDSLEDTTAARRSVEVSESPSPDLVQDAYDGDEDKMEPQEIQQDFISDTVVSYSYVQQLALSDLFSNVNKESDDRPMSLPDILKSSPLNPDKMDSGSSEGSPDFSPVHRSKNESPNFPISVPATNLFGFDSKILLLKEMAEETEAKTEENAKLEVEKISEQSFVAFDLVKGTDVPPKSDDEGLMKDKDDSDMSSQTSVQTVDKFECLNFPTRKAQEFSDSESPSADLFSPVLDAVAKNSSRFPVEHENRCVKEENEASDEVSEQEVSSEEFEFVERPPQGTADELLEMQESSAFMKPSEMLTEEDWSPKVDPQVTYQMPAAQDANCQSADHLLTELSDKSSAGSGKAGLELDFPEMSSAPLIHSPADTTGVEKKEARVSNISNLRAAAVLELVRWRDVRSSAVVFGSCLVLLLSLSVFSIISVLSYLSLALLSITTSFRIYKGVLQAIQKSEEGHPFKQYLEQDVSLSNDLVQKYSDVTLSRINSVMKELRRLFLVEDLVDSLKFALLLWIITYVGALFNGLTLLILGLLGAFSCPIIYEKHQTQIDHYLSMVKNLLKDVLRKIQATVPGMKKSE